MVRGFVVGRSPGVKFEADLDFLGDLGGITLTEGVSTAASSPIAARSAAR